MCVCIVLLLLFASILLKCVYLLSYNTYCHLFRPTPEKNGFHVDPPSENRSTNVSSPSLYHHSGHPSDSTQEDQEVVEIVRQGERYRNDSHPVNVVRTVISQYIRPFLYERICSEGTIWILLRIIN